MNGPWLFWEGIPFMRELFETKAFWEWGGLLFPKSLRLFVWIKIHLGDTRILGRTLANGIQRHIERMMSTPWQSGVYPKRAGFNIWQSMNEIHCIARIKRRKHDKDCFLPKIRNSTKNVHSPYFAFNIATEVLEREILLKKKEGHANGKWKQ